MDGRRAHAGVSADRRAGPVGFDAVDTSADPGGLIWFLDAANTTAGLTAARQAGDFLSGAVVFVATTSRAR